MNKKQKFTQAYFNEADPMMEIDTYNTDLKHRLRRFAEQYPELVPDHRNRRRPHERGDRQDTAAASS